MFWVPQSTAVIAQVLILEMLQLDWEHVEEMSLMAI